MIHVGQADVPLCDGVSRRSFLEAGATAMGLSLPMAMELEAAGAVDPKKQKIKNCITLFLVGSPGHLDTWDMKPDAPADIRGKFKPISTAVPGVQICEHFPRMARMMDQVALIRSLHHNTGASHENGQRWMMTGHDFNAANIQPHMGSVISRIYGQKTSLPASIVLPAKIGNTGTSTPHGQASGYLGTAHAPFFLGSDPAAKNFKVANLEPPKGQTEFRINSRRNLLKQLDAIQRKTETSSTIQRDTAYSRAFNLLTSPKTRAAFDLSKEPQSVRDRYGDNLWGNSTLVARKLVEAGSTFVTVNWEAQRGGHWDLHGNTFGMLRGHLPVLDAMVTALVSDLKSSGLLDTTLVVLMGEMGRTPRINAKAGRDHWPQAYTALVSGGGLKMGQLVGATNSKAEFPIERPYTPQDLLATIYRHLGIDIHMTFNDFSGRPISVLSSGQPIPELI